MCIFRVLKKKKIKGIFLEYDESTAELRWFVPASLKGTSTQHIWKTFCPTLKPECINHIKHWFCVKCWKIKSEHAVFLFVSLSFVLHHSSFVRTGSLWIYWAVFPEANPQSSYPLVRISNLMLFSVRFGSAGTAKDTVWTNFNFNLRGLFKLTLG